LDEKLGSAQGALIQALGRQSAFWGLGKTAGEMYAVLYLSDEPLSLEEVARSLKVTKGNISIAIRQLEQLGMVKRSRKIGDRRVFFTAETDFWQIAHSVLELRHKPEFAETFTMVNESYKYAEQAKPSPEKGIAVERLQALQEFYRLIDGIVETTLSMRPEQLKRIIKMIKIIPLKEKGE